MSTPTVSVVFAAYNASWCIERAVDTVFAQTVPVREIIVCDDGSTDGMPELIEKRYGTRVNVLRLPHRNAAAARCDGLAIASGDWLAFMDADDWWEPNKLERQFAFIAKHPAARWVSTDGNYESEDGVVRDSWLSDYFHPPEDFVGDLFPALIQRCFPLMSSMLVERATYHEAGGIDPAMVFSHDYDLWLRIAARHPGAIMAEKLVHYWFHPAALSRNFEARNRDNLMLMERIARGELRDDHASRRAGDERAIAIAFDVGLAHMRAGRWPESRVAMRRAGEGGPFKRRMLAAFASVAPGSLVRSVVRSDALKRAVLQARPGVPEIREPDSRA